MFIVRILRNKYVHSGQNAEFLLLNLTVNVVITRPPQDRCVGLQWNLKRKHSIFNNTRIKDITISVTFSLISSYVHINVYVEKFGLIISNKRLSQSLFMFEKVIYCSMYEFRNVHTTSLLLVSPTVRLSDELFWEYDVIQRVLRTTWPPINSI